MDSQGRERLGYRQEPVQIEEQLRRQDRRIFTGLLILAAIAIALGWWL